MHRWSLARVAALSIFAVQASLVILFFWNLGSGGLESALLAATGVCLELAKRQCWSIGLWKGRHRALIGLALLFSLISGLAAVAYSWSVTESGVDHALAHQSQVDQVLGQLRALDQERQAINTKLASLPADWVTQSLRYSSRLAELSREQQNLQQQLGELGATGAEGAKSGAYHIKRWVELMGLPWQTLVLGFLVLISLLLEVGVVLTLERPVYLPSTEPQDLARLILQTAFQAPGKPLLGRRKVAQKLKVSESEVRKVMERLMALKLAQVRPGYKGLFLCSSPEECAFRLTP